MLEVLLHLLNEVEFFYSALRRGENIYQEWRDKLETLGKVVQVKTGMDLENGFAESVDDDGALMLSMPDGALVRIVAGEVTLRP